MTVTIDIPDERFLEFARLFDGFLHNGTQGANGDDASGDADGGVLMGAKDIAALLGLAGPCTLYGSKRYALPPDDKAVKDGRAKFWPKSVVMSHLQRCGLVDAEGRRTARR